MKHVSKGIRKAHKTFPTQDMPVPKSKHAFCDFFLSTVFVCHLFLSQKATTAEIFHLVKNEFQRQRLLHFEDIFVNTDYLRTSGPTQLHSSKRQPARVLSLTTDTSS